MKQDKPELKEDAWLWELRAIRKLVIASLLASGVDATVIADVLGYKSASSITNEFPVRKLQEGRSHAKGRAE